MAASIKKIDYVVLIISGLIIAGAGPYASLFSAGIEDLFVFAAGLTNLVALFYLVPETFNKSHSLSIRSWLFFEMIFFCFVLGVDVRMAFTNLFTEEHDYILFVIAAILIFSALWHLVQSENREDDLAISISIVLFSVSIYLIPSIFRFLAPLILGLFKNFPVENPERLTAIIEHRSYAWIHLLAIPSVYYLVDSRVGKLIAKNGDKKNDWVKLIFLDKSLFFAGLACMISGFIYAFLGPTNGENNLYEAGAAALLLLLGNSWFVYQKTIE